MDHWECALIPFCKLLKCHLPSLALRPCPAPLQGGVRVCISPGPSTMFIRSPNAWSLGQNSAPPQKYPILPVLLKLLEKKCVDMECIWSLGSGEGRC